MNLIRFQNIKKRFKKKDILKNVSFSVKKGEIFGLIGKSGSGKSTLLKIGVGMVSKTQGAVFFEDKNIQRNLDYFKKTSGSLHKGTLL